MGALFCNAAIKIYYVLCLTQVLTGYIVKAITTRTHAVSTFKLFCETNNPIVVELKPFDLLDLIWNVSAAKINGLVTIINL